jgi:hypothetical protein
MRKYIKTAALVFIGILVVIQFIPTGKKNIQTGVSPQSMENTIAVPKEILAQLKSGCYDCHSNNTVYPWYSNIQPVAWWLNSHIVEGKEHLNFDEFGNLDAEGQGELFEEIEEVLKTKEMPMQSYVWMHPKARYSEKTLVEIYDWLALQQINKKPSNNNEPAHKDD